MTADVPAPPVQRLGITAQAVFRREDVGRRHRRQRLLPAGEAGAAPPVGVVLMRPQPQPAHRRLLIRHLEVQPDPRQRRQGFCPFAVHHQPQRTVRGEVHAPVADNHYLFAAQIVPAAVDEGFICQALRVAPDAVRLKIVQAGAFPALHPGVGVDTLYFADPDVVVERRANKLVTQGGQQLLLTANRPAAQQTRPAIDGPALRTGADLPDLIADDKIRSAGRHGGRRQRQRGGQGKLLPGDAVLRF